MEIKKYEENNKEILKSLHKETLIKFKNEIKKEIKHNFSMSNVSKFPLVKLESYQNKKFDIYVGKYVYLSIDKHPYGLFKWIKWKYILQDHKDGNKILILEKKKKYELVLKDFLKWVNIDYENKLSNLNTIKDIKEVFKKYVWTDKIAENLEKQVNVYIEKILNTLDYDTSWRYITYIDEWTNRLFLLKNINWKIVNIWYDKVSTWNPRRGSSYNKTPYIIVDREKLNLYDKDWRAEWTDRRWYWEKGSRICFLWKYFASKDGDVSLKNKKWYKELHLAFHTTTPWWLTQLWKPMSKWCIRTSRFINKLYDKTPEINKWLFIIWDVKNNIVPKNIYTILENKEN